MKLSTLLCAALITTQLLCMEQTQQQVQQPTTGAVKNYTITDLHTAITNKDATQAEKVITNLANQGSMDADSIDLALQHVMSVSDSLDSRITNWDVPYYQKIGLGILSLLFGGYEIGTTIYSLQDKSTTSVINGVTSSSNFPLAGTAGVVGFYLIKDGWQNKVTNQQKNIQKVQGLLQTVKKNKGTLSNDDTVINVEDTSKKKSKK